MMQKVVDIWKYCKTNKVKQDRNIFSSSMSFKNGINSTPLLSAIKK